MDVKKDILWRVYLCYIGMLVFAALILVKIFTIQHVEGDYWRSMADSLHDRYVNTEADRGTIFSDDGRMLSTSIPYFDIRLDMQADGLVEKNGQRFKDNIDSLSISLSGLFKDKSSAAYKKILQQAYRKKDRYFLLKKEITFGEYAQLREFPLFRLGRNKSGMIAETKNKRINPFRLLANRTVGLWRENAQNVGLEATYNAYLKGRSGKRLMRRIAGGTYIPIEGYEIEPEDGKDIYTTLDVNIQDIAENALYNMVSGNEAEHGTCIVMEVKTGKIKAIANLGRQRDGSYWEDYNYALMTTEPGSTFKLATLISVLEDHLVTPETQINLHLGALRFGKRTVYDSEHHGKTWVSVKKAFALSSNVGFAQLAYLYKSDPMKFVTHLRRLQLDKRTGIDLHGEGRPVIKTPASSTWSATSLPWMGFGYEVLVSPLRVLTLYNAVANDGKLMKPYLVNTISEYGKVIKEFHPTVVEKICSDTILHQVQDVVRSVVTEGTAHSTFKDAPYTLAGKTGTALVANGRRGYADHIYQSTFVGYFPAEHPVYSCIVVIKNKPHAARYYGASVAAPVFKEVADKLYAMDIEHHQPMPLQPHFDSLMPVKYGYTRDLENILEKLNLPFAVAGKNPVWSRAATAAKNVQLQPLVIRQGTVPDVTGMGLKDALYLLESAGLQVQIEGMGKVLHQSIEPGARINTGSRITIALG
ncbi:penicillin-binding protein [Compostibacter hankyongensis]|uniref:Penicillin-binding protein n=1 Tax=Compostibacter hankyongensis TaxID=1007089 RepID=A0ABP8FGS4_9BACT